MVRVILRMASWFVRIVWWVVLGLWIVTPWVLRAVWFTIRLMSLSVVSLIAGVPTAVRRISTAWMDRAVALGFPTEYDTILYHFTSVAAFLTLLVGWIILTVMTLGSIMLIGNAIVN